VSLLRKASPEGTSSRLGAAAGEQFEEEPSVFAEDRGLTSGSFRVEEFRVPLLRASFNRRPAAN